MPNALWACPACANPSAVLHALHDCVATSVVTFTANAHGEPVALRMSADVVVLDSLSNVRYECQGCFVQFNQPIDLNAPTPETVSTPELKAAHASYRERARSRYALRALDVG